MYINYKSQRVKGGGVRGEEKANKENTNFKIILKNRKQRKERYIKKGTGKCSDGQVRVFLLHFKFLFLRGINMKEIGKGFLF